MARVRSTIDRDRLIEDSDASSRSVDDRSRSIDRRFGRVLAFGRRSINRRFGRVLAFAMRGDAIPERRLASARLDSRSVFESLDDGPARASE
jgi:hypothetical protein